MLSERMKRLTPYVPGEQPKIKGLIKLNTNENPYPPCEGVNKVLKDTDPASLRLYPDPLCTELKESISRRYGVRPEQVFVSNGSDELLAFSFYAFFDSGWGPLLFPDITYSFYPVYCRLYNIDYREIPLKEDFSISVDEYLKVSNYSGIIFPNPNAPTGIALGLTSIKYLLDRTNPDRVVIIDEAYVDFGAESAIGLLDSYPNLLIIKTMSKAYSLAGMRIGYSFGNKRLIDAVTTVKDSFNSYPVSRLGQVMAARAFDDYSYHLSTCKRIMETRESMIRGLRKIGWDCLDSKSNFVFARHPSMEGRDVLARLREHKILVRHFTTPRIDRWLRISIGTNEETDMLLQACGELSHD